jgi:hypothetical protein
MSEQQEDTNEVLQFLQDMENTTEETKPFQLEAVAELSPEEMKELGKSLEESREEKEIEVPEIPVKDDFRNTPYQDLFSMMVADIGEVAVSDYEKDMFIKAVLNDTQFYTVSKILGGRLSMEVKSRTMYTDKLVFDSLNFDEQNKKIVGIDSMLYRLQMYVAACQLKSYGNKNVELHLDYTKTFDENYVILNQHVDKVLSQIPAHVWSAIVMGIRIHEYKSKLCMDNLNNENFWESAGINS